METITWVLEALLASTTLILRYYSILFVRYHPIGPRYMHGIYFTFAAYCCIAVASLFFSKQQSRKSHRHSSVVDLLLGWLDRRKPLTSFSSVLLNILCVGATVDFVYRGHVFHTSHELSFSRVGYVNNDSASIVIRAPGASGVGLFLQSEDGGDWHESKTAILLSQTNDFVGTFHVNGLLPDTVYAYKTNASHEGTFRTARNSPKHWTLLSTSCIKPFYPYNPLDHALRVKGLEYVDQFISSHVVDVMLFLGDFIYIDLPYPLGFSREDYTSAYRQVYASPSWTPALKAMPWLHVYDDHEIINDWSANETGLYQSALPPYWDYHGNANPPSQFGPGESYYTVQHGDVSFFVLDTRRYRSDSSIEDGPEKTMLGSQQLSDLLNWLRSEPAWKVVVSSVPFTRNWRGPDAPDCWAGYLWERETVLKAMRATDGVVILSGDRHEHATTIFPAGTEEEGKPIIEFSTSALNQFYEPFLRNHKQIEDTDIAVYNHYRGNSKFAAITFDTSNPQEWLTYFELIIDGKKVWNYEWKNTRQAL